MLRKQSQAVGVVTPDFQVAVKLLVCVRVISTGLFLYPFMFGKPEALGKFALCLGQIM